MSPSRTSQGCRHGSTALPSSEVRVLVAPKVGDARNTPAPIKLDAAIEALVIESERHPVPLAWAAGVVGMHGAFVGLCAVLREANSLDAALRLGWSFALAQLAVSIAAQPTEQSRRLTRHAGYCEGVRAPSRKPSAADRARAEAQRWGIARKAVA